MLLSTPPLVLPTPPYFFKMTILSLKKHISPLPSSLSLHPLLYTPPLPPLF